MRMIFVQAPLRQFGAGVARLRHELAEEVMAVRPRQLAEAGCLDAQLPGVPLVPAPHLDHADLTAIALGNVDPARNGDRLADLEFLGGLRHRLTVVALDEHGVVAGHLDRAAVPGAELVAALIGRVGDQRCAGAETIVPPVVNDGTAKCSSGYSIAGENPASSRAIPLACGADFGT